MHANRRMSCPVTRYDRAPEGYAESVAEWIANPHAYFVAFGAEARAFQKRHRSERLRTMTLVAEECAQLEPSSGIFNMVRLSAQVLSSCFLSAIATASARLAAPSFW